MFGVLGTAVHSAQAATIDFNSLTGSNLVTRGFQYQEDGFQLDNHNINQSPFLSVYNGNFAFTGTPNFFNDTINGVTRLTQIGGGAFTLSSIDLESVLANNASVTFTATLFGGGTTSQTFTTDLSFPSLETFTFGPAFANITGRK